MKRTFIYLLLYIILFSSCQTGKQTVRLKNQRAQLSQQLGFKVTPKDDLRLLTEAVQWLGTPYRYGGTTRKGVDCSGLVGQIYQQAYHKTLARNTQDIANKNCRKVSKGNLKTGNLVFFNTSEKKKKGINHVGLYLKNGNFIHASTSRGVIISNLQEKYYREKWRQGGAVRIKEKSH